MREQIEAGDTVQFTFVTSVAPDTTPLLSVYGSGDTLVASIVSVQSASTAYYSMFTAPSSADGVYLAEWYATKNVSGTAYPFRKRFLFNVARTSRGE